MGPGDGPGTEVRGGPEFWGGGGESLSFAWDLHSGPCSSTKVHEVISDVGRLLPLPPAVLPLCAAHAAWGGMQRVSPPPCTPCRGWLGGGQGVQNPGGVTQQRSPLKPRAPRAPPKGFGGFPVCVWGGKAERGEQDPHPTRLVGAGGIYTPPHPPIPKMPRLGGGHSPPNPSWPATPPERRAKPSAPTGDPHCSAPHPPSKPSNPPHQLSPVPLGPSPGRGHVPALRGLCVTL